MNSRRIYIWKIEHLNMCHIINKLIIKRSSNFLLNIIAIIRSIDQIWLCKTTSKIMIPKYKVVRREKKTLSTFNIHNQTDHICWSRRSIIRTQFSIQLATIKIIHHFRGLSLSMNWFLIPLMLKKHGLTYTTLSYIRTKEKLFLLVPIQHENFYVVPRIHIGNE